MVKDAVKNELRGHGTSPRAVNIRSCDGRGALSHRLRYPKGVSERQLRAAADGRTDSAEDGSERGPPATPEPPPVAGGRAPAPRRPARGRGGRLADPLLRDVPARGEHAHPGPRGRAGPRSVLGV